jgi:hypothetical protein
VFDDISNALDAVPEDAEAENDAPDKRTLLKSPTTFGPLLFGPLLIVHVIPSVLVAIAAGEP